MIDCKVNRVMFRVVQGYIALMVVLYWYSCTFNNNRSFSIKTYHQYLPNGRSNFIWNSVYKSCIELCQLCQAECVKFRWKNWCVLVSWILVCSWYPDQASFFSWSTSIVGLSSNDCFIKWWMKSENRIWIQVDWIKQCRLD